MVVSKTFVKSEPFPLRNTISEPISKPRSPTTFLTTSKAISTSLGVTNFSLPSLSTSQPLKIPPPVPPRSKSPRSKSPPKPPPRKKIGPPVPSRNTVTASAVPSVIQELKENDKRYKRLSASPVFRGFDFISQTS